MTSSEREICDELLYEIVIKSIKVKAEIENLLSCPKRSKEDLVRLE